MKKRICILTIVVMAILMQPGASIAQSNYEFYFFGVNLKVFKNSDWGFVIAGALTSVIIHELGHVFYLESQDKDWQLFTSSSGFTVYTDNHLTDKQYRIFGRAGFALQTGIGSILTLFDKTKYHDFTKGWVFMNTIQLCTYEYRGHNTGDDFALIERGKGNHELELSMFTFISQNNLKPFASSLPLYSDFFKIHNKKYDNAEIDYDTFVAAHRNHLIPFGNPLPMLTNTLEIETNESERINLALLNDF